jgi:hypothetical protein
MRPSSAGEQSPRAEYSRLLESRRAAEDRWRRRESVISGARLVVFLAGALLAWLAIGTEILSIGWVSVPVTIFGGLVVAHEVVIRARNRARRAVAFYEKGVARLDDCWAGTGATGERFLDPHHPYAVDLDLFGRGTIFELLCAARTSMGENALASWLKATARPEKIRARQAAVEELRPRLDLRETLAVVGEDVRAGVDPSALTKWSTAEPVLLRPKLRYVAAACSVISVATLVAWAFPAIGAWPFLAAISIQAVIAAFVRSRVRDVLAAVDRPGEHLVLLSQILAHLEREAFSSPLLAELREALDSEGEPPSRRIGSLARWIDRLNWRRNQIFAPFGALMMWGTQCALAIESWRAAHGGAVSVWLSTVGELEALASLAGYAFEHPEDPFPEILDDGSLFDGEGLGHPLLPGDRCVRNDLRLDGDRRLFVVSGSNMSGKSTLLRTVGVNAVLAQAGAPVRARKLRISPLAVGATMRVQDSLQEGASRFYAEITRMRQLVEIANGPLPLLFLLDEILHGTNSHDRRIGAEAIVRGLVDRKAIGLITTHDLALSRIADVLSPVAENVHFEDRLEDGRVTFDYTLRPGVVRKSNALELMRGIGLEV